ncbi:MAG TPA: hypothetical protein VFG67_10710 [Oleiagrimonas sp.]|nr:hypothetical protein [Oleiagrimonas sp.]
MPVPSIPGEARPRPRPAVWRIVTWLVLMLAMFGILQYSVHAWHVAAALDAAPSADRASLTGMLAWDILYLVVACITVSASAGALFRRAWARPVLRVVVGVLALWLLVTAIQMAAHWSSLSNQSALLMSQSTMSDAGRMLLERIQRRYLIAMILKAVGVPVLAWLAWRLGTSAVRAQFPASARKTDSM